MNVIRPIDFSPVKAWQLGSNAFGSPKMYVYCYLIDGLLIDTGQPRIKKELSQVLEKEHIDKIIVTHHHEDHSGNIEALKKLKGIEAYSSLRCSELLRKPERVEFARWMTWGQHTPAQLIAIEGQTIQTDNYQFEIIDTPGHSEDHISLYEPSQGWLFSGDIFINDYIKMFMKDEMIGHHILSLRKLLDLDFDKLFCNHQPVMTNPKDRISNKLKFFEGFYDKVSKEYQKGNDVKGIMKNLNFKDDKLSKLMSWGQLSKSNMVRSVIKSIDQKILMD